MGNFLTILKGSHKDKKIPSPISIKGHQHATQQKIKESVFQIIDNHVKNFQSVFFIDLFAGSGQMGWEAYSRQALFTLFLETSPERIGAIYKWAQKYIAQPSAEELDLYPFRCEKRDAVRELKKLLENTGGYLDKYLAAKKPGHLVIFADPPYGLTYKDKLLTDHLTEAWLNSNPQNLPLPTLLIIQTNVHDLRNSKIPELKKIDGKKEKNDLFHLYHYGKNRLLVFSA